MFTRSLSWYVIPAVLTPLVALMSVNGAEAAEPPRVLRAMLVFTDEPLSWDQDGSVALIATGNHSGVTDDTLNIGGPLTATAISDTLLHNRPDLSDDLRADVALFLEATFGNTTLGRPVESVKHVGTGGVDRPFVYFRADDLPTSGALAEAGPDGDVLVLGEFGLRQKLLADNNWPYYLTDVPEGAWLILPPDSSGTTAIVQIAIGRFTK